MTTWRQACLVVLGIAVGLLGPRAHGYPGMKSSRSSRGAVASADEPAGLPPGGTPPPATVSGLKALFADDDAALPTSGPGLLTGQVRDVVSQSPVLEGLLVTLAMVRGDEVVKEAHAETDPSGKFVFRDLATDGSVSYQVSVIYQGVRYATAPIVFEAGRNRAETTIDVYPSGPAPGKARVKGTHVILAPMGDAVQVTEMIFIENPEDKALIGDADGIVTFVLQLPKTASNLSVDQGLQRDQISVGDGNLYYEGPIYPGTNQVVISYLVRPATGWTFERRMAMPVEMFDVFVKARSLEVESGVLGPGEHLDMRGTPFVRYHGGPFDAGTLLSFRLKAGTTPAAPTGAGGLSAVPIAVMVALFVSLFVALPLLRPASAPFPYEETSEEALRRHLEAERDRHLLAVADLDLDYQAGKLDEEDYRKLREEHKAAAIAIMRQLDQLGAGAPTERKEGSSGQARTSPGAARFCTQCGRRLGPDDKFCARCGARAPAADG